MDDDPDTAPTSASEPRARLIDVARASGVSKGVVSRLLNGDETIRLRPQTRARVLEAAERLGYRPHAGARALSTARAGALAVLVPDLANQAYAAIIRGVYGAVREHGYTLLVAEDRDGGHEAPDYVELVRSGRVDGLLIASARPGHPLVERLTADPGLLPHVFVNREVSGSDRNVGLDNEAASALVVEHLRGHGHRRIAMVSGPPRLSPAADRLHGFQRAMRRGGAGPGWYASDDFSEAGGYRAATRLLTAHPEVTALYTSSLRQAVGALRAAREAGRRVPQDLSVVTYDELPLAAFLDPPLTTVRVPVDALGAAAVEALLAQIAGEPPRSRRISAGQELVERSSVAPPADG